MNIEFHYQTDFRLEDEGQHSTWLGQCVVERNYEIGTIAYIFMSDEKLLEMNKQYLNHDTYTDIITFDYTVGKALSGDIFISCDRVRENAVCYGVNSAIEMRRVMAHGVLHLMGYQDKSELEKKVMRGEENKFMEMFHVEQ